MSIPTTFRLTEEEPQPEPMLQPMLHPQLQPMLQPMLQPQLQLMLQPQLQPHIQQLLQPQMQTMNQTSTSISKDEGSNHITIQESDMDQDVLAFKVDVEGDLNS